MFRRGQDEKHVLFDCQKTADIRTKYFITQTNLSEFFNEFSPVNSAKIIHEVLSRF